jgi:5-methylcytosine-specific restriction endonuclease McrA
VIRAKAPKPKVCKVCKTKFTPQRHLMTARVCSPICGMTFAKSQRVKAEKVRLVKERKETKAALEKYKKIPELIAAAQVKFNEFIRLRDKEKGCFVCGRPFRDVPGQVQHAGHVRSRGAAGHLRFNEDNCHGECEGCNNPKGGAKPHQIKAGAIARIGRERWEALDNSNEVHKWSREELIAIKAEYAEKAKELKARQE